MRYVLYELQLNRVRYIKDVKEAQYTTVLKNAQRFDYSKAHMYAGALQHLGFDFTPADMDIAEKIERVWYGKE